MQRAPADGGGQGAAAADRWPAGPQPPERCIPPPPLTPFTCIPFPLLAHTHTHTHTQPNHTAHPAGGRAPQPHQAWPRSPSHHCEQARCKVQAGRGRILMLDIIIVDMISLSTFYLVTVPYYSQYVFMMYCVIFKQFCIVTRMYVLRLRSFCACFERREHPDQARLSCFYSPIYSCMANQSKFGKQVCLPLCISIFLYHLSLSHTPSLPLPRSSPAIFPTTLGATHYIVYKQMHRGLVLVSDPVDPPIRDDLLLQLVLFDTTAEAGPATITLWCRASSA
jgi:hypothetical protein